MNKFRIYFFIPCLSFLLILLLYGVFMKSVEEYASDTIYAAIDKGNPEYAFTLSEQTMSEITDSDGTVSEDEIKNPTVGQKYGALICDAIGLNTSVYFGDSDEVLKLGVGQYVKSSLPGFGKTILIGGHDSTFFAPLEDITAGDQIQFYTDYGVYTYEVRETSVAMTDDTSACQLDSEAEQLILYTCYPFGQVLRARDQRYFVYCDKISGPTIEKGEEP